MLTIENLAVNYGAIQALRGVSLTVISMLALPVTLIAELPAAAVR